MNILGTLQRKYGRYAIPGLIRYIVFANAILFFMQMAYPNLHAMLMLDPAKVLSGEVWRLFTFVLVPPPLMSPIFFLFFAYLLYIYGTALEHEWGTFKFNVFYFGGMICNIIAGFLLWGHPTTIFGLILNTTIFLAFATIYPNFELLLMFLLPVKVKYLAYLTWGLLVLLMIEGPWELRLAIVASVANYFCFFGKDIYTTARIRHKAAAKRQHIQAADPVNSGMPFHHCAVCGLTEKDDVTLEFRVCTKCEGSPEYCIEHIRTHEHRG